MADSDLLARQQAEGHKSLLMLETEFNTKPRTAVLSIQGSQIRALAQFPAFFQTYPSPVILNAAILKLADWFHHGNNVVRMHIYKVLESVSKNHLTEIINVDETMRRILPVLGSNDPTARALTLRVFGCMAIIYKDSLDVQHGLLQRVQQSTDRFETEAAVWASDQFCLYSTTYLSVMFMRIQSKLADPTTSFDIQLKLINILRHMHSDIAMARQAKQLCLQLLDERVSEERLVIVVLRTLTKLLSVALIDQREQIDRLLSYLLHDGRILVQQSVLQDLQHLSHNDIMFDASHIATLLSGIAESTAISPRLQLRAYKCAETLIRSHHTLIHHILHQTSASTEHQILRRTLNTCRTTLDNSIKQGQYNLALGCAQLLVAIAEVSTTTTILTGDTDEPMPDASDDSTSLAYDNRSLLQHVIDQLLQIPIDRIYNEHHHSCKKVKKLMINKSKLLLLLNNQDGKDSFLEGYNMMITYSQKEVGYILLHYCTSISRLCHNISSWFPHIALDSLEKQVDTPIIFMNILRLLFRTVPTEKMIVDDILRLLRLFGEWDESTGKYQANGWHLYQIGKEAGVCGWHSVMHTVMNDLQSMVESDSCMYWLSGLSLLGSAEWSLSQNKYGEHGMGLIDPVNLYVTTLTKLKAFNAVTGCSKFQIWFLRLRMEMIHATQHMLTTLETIRRDELDEYRIFKMMNSCADSLRTLASRYDIASQSMLEADTGMIMVMEDFKISALILEHAAKICVKSSDSFFYIDPTLLSLLSRNTNAPNKPDTGTTASQLYKFRTMCIGFLQDMIKWEEEQDTGMAKQRYLNATETFCQDLLCCPLIIPPSFFKVGHII